MTSVFPVITGRDDIFNQRDELIKAAHDHPNDDKIYYFPNTHGVHGTDFKTLLEINCDGVCVAGSAALYKSLCSHFR